MRFVTHLLHHEFESLLFWHILWIRMQTHQWYFSWYPCISLHPGWRTPPHLTTYCYSRQYRISNNTFGMDLFLCKTWMKMLEWKHFEWKYFKWKVRMKIFQMKKWKDTYFQIELHNSWSLWAQGKHQPVEIR